MREIPLSNGMTALVDDEDYARVVQFNWHVNKYGGGLRAFRNSRTASGAKTVQYLHRYLMPDAALVDHVNGNALDNRRANLREATYTENVRNTKKRPNRSGYKGVTWHSKTGKWHAGITVNKRRISLGYYSDPAEAAHAYDHAARQHFGEFARFNFPTGEELPA